MATVTLTVRYLDSLHSHGKRFEVFDALVPGLAVRVSASGRKSFTLYYRHQGRMRRLGLGRYPDVLLEKARKIATQHRGRIYDGADPAGDKQAEQAHNEQTVQALYDLYRTNHEKTLRSWSEVRRIMEREVLPVWRHRRVVDLHRRDIRELVERKARTAPIQANRVLQRISAMLSFAVDRIGLNRIRRGGSRSRAGNAVAIACSRARSSASCGRPYTRPTHKTTTARRSRGSRRRSTMCSSSCCSRRSAAARCAKCNGPRWISRRDGGQSPEPCRRIRIPTASR